MKAWKNEIYMNICSSENFMYLDKIGEKQKEN